MELQHEQWITEKFQKPYDDIKKEVVDIWERSKAKQDWYTPHNADHNEGVERWIKKICEPILKLKDHEEIYPNPTERFILSTAAWLHDMGMCPEVYKSKEAERLIDQLKSNEPVEDKARRIHHKISADYITRKYTSFGEKENENENKILAAATSIVSLYHRKREYILKCPETRVVGEISIRLRLLAALLRLADGLHIGSERCKSIQYQIMMMGPMPWEAQFHWLKSFAVSGIDLNHEKHCITIQVDIPYVTGEESVQWDRLSNSLGQDLKREIEEELDEINKILAINGGFPTYWDVKYSVHQIPMGDLDREKQLMDVLQNKEIAHSPNAGRLFQSVKDEVLHLLNDSLENVIESVKKFKDDFLRRILEERPCHVALVRIDKLLDAFIDEPDQQGIDSVKSILSNMDEQIESNKISINALDSAEGKDLKERLCSAKEIYLFAYSVTVEKFLSTFNKTQAENKTLIIGECRPKTSYAFNNVPLYLDGFEYAKLLTGKYFKEIQIIPDIEIGSRLKMSKKEESVVLLGANGLNIAEKKFGYSAGHLMVCQSAQKLGIPIIVITDSIKIGAFKVKQNLQRETEWFCSYRPIIEELDKHSIVLKNIREDLIEMQDIDWLITNKGCVKIKENIDAATKKITEWKEFWDNHFDLKKHLSA